VLLYFLFNVIKDEDWYSDSIKKALGVKEYEYKGWFIVNWDTIPARGIVPEPDGEIVRVEGEHISLRYRWKNDGTRNSGRLRPMLWLSRRGLPLDAYDGARYLVFYVRGQGVYYGGVEIVHRGACKYGGILPDTIQYRWKAIRIDLDSIRVLWTVEEMRRRFEELGDMAYMGPKLYMGCGLPGIRPPEKARNFAFFYKPHIAPKDIGKVFQWFLEISPLYFVK